MDVTSIASLASATAARSLAQQVQLSVLKTALEIERQGALALLQALPQPLPAGEGSLGTRINTFA